MCAVINDASHGISYNKQTNLDKKKKMKTRMFIKTCNMCRYKIGTHYYYRHYLPIIENNRRCHHARDVKHQLYFLINIIHINFYSTVLSFT